MLYINMTFAEWAILHKSSIAISLMVQIRSFFLNASVLEATLSPHMMAAKTSVIQVPDH